MAVTDPDPPATDPDARPEPVRRRRRPPVSCTLCRRRKIRCSKGRPCDSCLRSRTGVDCVYDEDSAPISSNPSSYGRSAPYHTSLQRRVASKDDRLQGPQQARGPSHYATPRGTETASSVVSASTTPNDDFHVHSSSHHASPEDTQVMSRRIRELEEKLAMATSMPPHLREPSFPAPEMETLSLGISGDLHVQRDTARELGGGSRCVAHKNRVFGQSHWIHGLVALLFDTVRVLGPYTRDKSSNAVRILAKCKALSRLIKTRREPPWPVTPTVHLPPRDIADQLVERYIHTVDSLYRILHIPSFETEYEGLWQEDATPDLGFVILVKLAMAIGTLTYDERFSHRADATRWVHEAHAWTSRPRFKSRLGLRFIQIHLLLLIAHDLLGTNGGGNWVSAGTVLRIAMSMGLHIDPSHLPKAFASSAEMRRRLWNVTLELTLHTSLSLGSPPLLSLSDYDTESPANINDDEIDATDPVLRPDTEPTQMTIVRALRATFPVRLATAKMLNDTGVKNDYAETLRLDTELRTAYRNLCKTIQNANKSGMTLHPLACRMADLMMQRCILNVHLPFFSRSLRDPTFAYSRKAAVDAALRTWCTINPSSPLALSSDSGHQPDEDDKLLHRMLVGSPGINQNTTMPVVGVIAMDLRAQLQEEQHSGLAPVALAAPLRRNLLGIIDEVSDLVLQTLKVGGTNANGLVFISLLKTQMAALQKGVGRREAMDMLISGIEEAAETCLGIFEEMERETREDGQSPDDNHFEALGDVMSGFAEGDGDYMLYSNLFDDVNVDHMNWMWDEASMTS